MTEQQQAWQPDPNFPWIDQQGKNTTHVFDVDREITTRLDHADMNYLTTYKNAHVSNPPHPIDRRDEKLLLFNKVNYFDPTPNYASPLGLKQDHMVFLGGVSGVTHFDSDSCVQLGAQEPVYETLLQSAIWNEKNNVFAGAVGMAWKPSDRLEMCFAGQHHCGWQPIWVTHPHPGLRG